MIIGTFDLKQKGYAPITGDLSEIAITDSSGAQWRISEKDGGLYLSLAVNSMNRITGGIAVEPHADNSVTVRERIR